MKIRLKIDHTYERDVEKERGCTNGFPWFTNGALPGAQVRFSEYDWEEVPEWTRWDGVSTTDAGQFVINTPDGCKTYIPLPFYVRARMIENGLIQFEKREP